MLLFLLETRNKKKPRVKHYEARAVVTELMTILMLELLTQCGVFLTLSNSSSSSMTPLLEGAEITHAIKEGRGEGGR